MPLLVLGGKRQRPAACSTISSLLGVTKVTLIAQRFTVGLAVQPVPPEG